jgi:HEPN domain-containing protein
MSIEKCKFEADRWLITAKDDLDSAVILKQNNKFAHACFHSQQAAEKAVKAVWYLVDSDPWGHSIKKLIDDLEQVDINKYNILKKLERAGRLLDRFYIPTRYPNGLPDITPDAAYTDEDADTCIGYAGAVLKSVSTILTAS